MQNKRQGSVPWDASIWFSHKYFRVKLLSHRSFGQTDMVIVVDWSLDFREANWFADEVRGMLIGTRLGLHDIPSHWLEERGVRREG